MLFILGGLGSNWAKFIQLCSFSGSWKKLLETPQSFVFSLSLSIIFSSLRLCLSICFSLSLSLFLSLSLSIVLVLFSSLYLSIVLLSSLPLSLSTPLSLCPSLNCDSFLFGHSLFLRIVFVFPVFLSLNYHSFLSLSLSLSLLLLLFVLSLSLSLSLSQSSLFSFFHSFAISQLFLVFLSHGDCLVSYPGHSLDGVLLLRRDEVGVFHSPSRLSHHNAGGKVTTLLQ